MDARVRDRDISRIQDLISLDEGWLDRRIFWEESIYQLELERLFARAWLFVAHESQIPEEHKYLMHGVFPQPAFDVVKTTQYSQRPHLALLSFYRGMMGQLPQDARTFIEDWFYGPVANSPWEFHKLGIYHPRRDIKRSYHLDGRAGAEKREATW